MTVKRPAIKYFGGKWRLAPKIIKWFPAHNTYVEPFGGAASVLLRKEPSKVEVYNDIDSDVVNFFRVMRDNAGDLLFRLHYTPYSREEYLQCVNYNGSDPVEKARAFFVRSWQGFVPSGAAPDATWKTTKSRSNSAILPPPNNALLDIVARLRCVLVDNRDFRDVFQRYDTIQTLFYIDPPYLDEGKRYVRNISEQDHIDLARILASIDGFAIISATDSKLYRQLYVDWLWEPLKVSGWMHKSKTEFLIMNYSL